VPNGFGAIDWKGGLAKKLLPRNSPSVIAAPFSGSTERLNFSVARV
jgi:hypothetical protein